MATDGVILFHCDWTLCPPRGIAAFPALNAWRTRLFDAGLIGVSQPDGIGYGNVSARCPGSPASFLVTGTQTGHIRELTPDHYAIVTGWDFEQNRIVCQGPVRASAESLTHAALYGIDERIQAVFHGHHDRLWRHLLATQPSSVPEAGYGTPAMALELRRLYRETRFRETRIMAMGGHEGGVVSFGESLDAAGSALLDALRQAG